MKVNKENLQLIHSAITHFVGQPVIELSKHGDLILFQTMFGISGEMEPNYNGNWDIWIDEEVVYEVEKDIIDLIEYDMIPGSGILGFYNIIKDINEAGLKFKSKMLLNIMRVSAETTLLNENAPMEDGVAQIGIFEIHSKNRRKIRILLN